MLFLMDSEVVYTGDPDGTLNGSRHACISLIFITFRLYGKNANIWPLHSLSTDESRGRELNSQPEALEFHFSLLILVES